jgi:hypothetical protein
LIESGAVVTRVPIMPHSLAADERGRQIDAAHRTFDRSTDLTDRSVAKEFIGMEDRREGLDAVDEKLSGADHQAIGIET